MNKIIKGEIWKDVAGYENLYKISNKGRVLSYKGVEEKNCFKKGKMLKQPPNNEGNLRLNLHKKGNRKSFLVHRLVATHFIENKKNRPEVNHIDGNKLNNNVENLRWVTGERTWATGEKLKGVAENTQVKMEKVKEIADKEFDGHFTLMKFTTNWGFVFGTVEKRKDVDYSIKGETLDEVLDKAIENKKSVHDEEHTHMEDFLKGLGIKKRK